MDTFIAFFLAFVPITLFLDYVQAAPPLIFISAALGIIPLAKFIGDATEDLAERSGPAVGGLLNATFGNATELIIGLLALHAGLVEVVKASITGSILGNVLLVLGTSMLFGGASRERQRFNATAAKTAGSMLLLATVALVIPAIFTMSSSGGYIATANLSIFVAILMIIAYVANLIFTLHTHKHLYVEEGRVVAPRWSFRKAAVILLVATVVVAIVSDILVASIEPVVANFGWSELFIGVVVVAIIGNIAEHLSAIKAAIKDRMDLALQISIGSATQIVMLVAPVLVLVSLFFQDSMNLVFNPFELVAIIFAAFVTNAVVEDGESTWLEGFQLLTAYVIIAVAFFLYP